MDTVIERPRPADPEALVGMFRRFGYGGPPYVVLAVDAERRTGTIRVLDSGEEFDYSIDKIAADAED